MKKVLIIGSTSTVGSAIGRRLSGKYTALFAGRRSADFPLALENPDLSVFNGTSFDLVIHSAANFSNDIDMATRINAEGALCAARIAKKTGATHFILMSSISAAYRPHDHHYGAYAATKLQGENLARAFCEKESLPLCVLRPTQIYDAKGLCRTHQKLLYTIVDRAAKGEDILLHGKNDPCRNYLFLDDLCEVAAKVADQQLEGLHACLAPQSLRLSEIAALAQTIFDKGGAIRFLEDMPDIPDLPPLPENSLRDHIGYAPCTSLEQGMIHIREST